MPTDGQEPNAEAPSTPPAGETPASAPAAAETPSGEQNPETPASSSASGGGDVDKWKTAAEEYEKVKPTLEAAMQLEQLLSGDKEIADAMTAALNGIAEKRAGGKKDTAPAAAPAQAPSAPAANGEGGPVTAEQLQNEIRFRDYSDEFVKIAKAAGVTPEIAQDAFDGTLNELLKLNKDPLRNFDITLVDKAFKAWNEKADRIVKARNDAYARSKAQDIVPAQGSGSAPKEAEKELNSPEDRRAFIEQGLRAANTVH